MAIEFQWLEPIALRSMSQKDISRIRENLEKQPGIYVFARRWGKSFEALYIGQALNICSRVTQQLNNHKLLEHVSTSKAGAKVLLVGYLDYKGYTNQKKALSTAEKAFIRYAVSTGHALHNKQGTTRIKTEEIFSLGKAKNRIFPPKIEVEI